MHGHRDGDAFAYPDRDGDTLTYCDGNRDGHVHGHCDGDAFAYPDGDILSHADQHGDVHTDIDADRHTNRNGDADPMIRTLLTFLFPHSLRNRVPLLPDDYQVHVMEHQRQEKFDLEDYLIMGAGLARTPQQAQRLRARHGNTDAWGVIRTTCRRKRKRLPAWKRLWMRVWRWLQ